MKIGDLVCYNRNTKEWGFIIAEHRSQWLVHWHDGDQAWIFKRNVVLLEAQ